MLAGSNRLEIQNSFDRSLDKGNKTHSYLNVCTFRGMNITRRRRNWKTFLCIKSAIFYPHHSCFDALLRTLLRFPRFRTFYTSYVIQCVAVFVIYVGTFVWTTKKKSLQQSIVRWNSRKFHHIYGKN